MSDEAAAQRGLRVGEAELVKGGARVVILSADSAAMPPEPGPALSEAQAAEAGLFQPRLIEFGETREETVVSTRPVVREELVVDRKVEHRVERIDETIRRTEVEVEELQAGNRARPARGERGA